MTKDGCVRVLDSPPVTNSLVLPLPLSSESFLKADWPPIPLTAIRRYRRAYNVQVLEEYD